jgi:formylglycine-generating enzyme required for sulfatase activity
MAVVSVQLLVGLLVAVVIGESLVWRARHDLPLEALKTRWLYKLGKTLPFPELVPIPAGRFTMGSSKDKDAQLLPVIIPEPFYLGATEVTFEQYDAFLEGTGRSQMKPSDSDWGRGTMPVINVDWYGARAYASWLGAMTGSSCQLPSDAQWEYACRAGTNRDYGIPAPEGSDEIQRRNLANCADCGSEWDGRQTAPVDRFPANAWNLHDMHGNVWEWIEDCVESVDRATRKDESAGDKGTGCSARVLSGGSWSLDQVNARAD